MNDRVIIRVRDVMSPEYDLVDGLMTVTEALQSIRHPNNRCLIIDKRDDDDEYGLVLMSDIAKKILARDRSPERVNIYEIMTKPVLCVTPEMDIRYCSRLFERFNLNLAPVVEERHIIGIVNFTTMVLNGLAGKT